LTAAPQRHVQRCFVFSVAERRGAANFLQTARRGVIGLSVCLLARGARRRKCVQLGVAEAKPLMQPVAAAPLRHTGSLSIPAPEALPAALLLVDVLRVDGYAAVAPAKAAAGGQSQQQLYVQLQLQGGAAGEF
jgi:hypothetical protein